MKKRFLTMFLAILLVVSLVPMAAMAAGLMDCTECGEQVIVNFVHQADGTDNVVCVNGHILYTGWVCQDAEGHAPKCDHVLKNYEPTESGHKLSCDCGEKTQEETCDFSNEGVCKCGKICTCNFGIGFVNNGNGTHSTYCEHGKHIATTECTNFDENGACVACGYTKTTEPENPDKQNPNPEEKPEEKPATDSKGLDNVPKTGDNGSLIVVTSMTVLVAIAGVAFVFNKKKAF